ncbi:alpha/beta hydrolase [Chitinophaga qingshengii]|uniref:Alpha/beta hydrolase n=1 Tax=Chitinophaga qingshengii TaxID=1569794 RepID=A0ABR7TNL5_9BACT|nr:alpha/beta hydrolase [Chitinophaga qingshengii]MBC9931106.1 alpha/beta hydrolase [Chitinophaga qingshengii]
MNEQLSLSREVVAALDFIQAIPMPAIADPVLAGRKFYEGFIPMAGEPETLFHIEDREVPSSAGAVPIRIYRPSALPLLPVVLYFHGGWFNAGNLETHDRPVRSLARLSNAVFIAVDYRLAPEYPFPYGFNDSIAVLQWVHAHAAELGIDASCIALAGDSAGGALAAALTRRAVKTMGIDVRCQALIYPVTDSSLQTASWQTFADGPNLTLEGGRMAWDMYTPASADRNHPDAAPLLAGDLNGLPPTLILTAEYDPLRDEAVQYADRLQSEGVNVQLSAYKGMIHGFFQMGGMIPDGKRAIEEVAVFLKAHNQSAR